MVAAVVTSEGIRFVGAVGVRKRGTEIPVTLSDQWHLGSDGKIMTSTLIARLVERGQLRWDTTLAEVFPEVAGQMHPDFRQVTLLQLLSHRAGLPENLNLRAYSGADARNCASAPSKMNSSSHRNPNPAARMLIPTSAISLRRRWWRRPPANPGKS